MKCLDKVTCLESDHTLEFALLWSTGATVKKRRKKKRKKKTRRNDNYDGDDERQEAKKNLNNEGKEVNKEQKVVNNKMGTYRDIYFYLT